VTGQGNDDQIAIPENIKTPIDFAVREGMIPVGPKVSFPFVFRFLNPLHFLPRNKESGLGKKLIAARVVKVEMGIHHISDIFRPQADPFQLNQDSRTFIPQGLKGPGQPSPSGEGIPKHAGVGAGVKKNIPLGMTDDENRHRPHDHFLPGSIGDKNILSTANQTATQGIESHLFSLPFLASSFPHLMPNSILETAKLSSGFKKIRK
jgi:hypothetical protein